MPGDFWSTQSCPLRIGPPSRTGIWGLIVDCEVRAEAAPCAAWDRARDLADGKINNPGRFSRSARSAIDGEFPYPAASGRRIPPAQRRPFDLALATPLCPPACDGAPDHGQPARVDKSVSVDLARRKCEPSLVDGIRVPNAVRSIASSRSSTVISARAADETSEMDFRRSRRASSGGRRASTSLVIAVTAVVATRAPKLRRGQNLRGKTKTPTARSCPSAVQPLPELPLRKSPRSASIVRGGCRAYRVAQRARPVPGLL